MEKLKIKKTVISSTQNLASSSRVLLHPSIMSRLKLGAGDACWMLSIEESGCDILGIGLAWPSIAIPTDQCSLSPESVGLTTPLEDGNLVGISRVNEAIPEVSEVSLISLLENDENMINEELFQMFAKEQMTHRKFFIDGQTVIFNFMGKSRRYQVQLAKKNSFTGSLVYPKTFLARSNATAEDGTEVLKDQKVFAFTGNSNIKTSGPKPLRKPSHSNTIKYSDIGGLKQQIEIVRETVETPLLQPQIYRRFGLQPPKGILLYGPPGTGKTLIARVVAQNTSANFHVINGAELTSKFVGETETKLRDIFEEARENSPSIIFIDEMDSLCPKRDDSSSNETEKRVVATLLTLMDGVGTKEGGDNLVVLGATNRPNSIDPALRRPGRFDKEIEIPVPNSDERLEILEIHLRNVPHSITKDDLKQLASTTHGYVGADLAALCREAGMHAIKRWTRLSKPVATATNDVTDQLDKLSIKTDETIIEKVTMEDFVYAKTIVGPSAMREITLQIPKTHWTDIGGMQEQKQCLQESIIFPLKYPDTFARMGIHPPKGILLYGPPGCSKTLLAKALATESEHNFFLVKGGEVFNPYVGESERLLREVFRKARVNAPSIIFFDEIDVLAGRRDDGHGGSTKVGDRILTTLLNEMDGVELLQHVTVVGATNRPDILDPALVRPGRLDRLVYVGPPDSNARKAIFELQCKKTMVDVDLDELVDETDGWTGAEIVGLCREAAMLAIREDPANAAHVKHGHFIQALSKTKTRLTPDLIKHYEDFAAKMNG